LATSAGEDVEVEVGKAGSAIRRFIWQHPQMISQKAAIIVEHFRGHTAAALGGRAKAMVVTESRASAVRYKQAIDKHIAQQHYTDVHALVAFSGDLEDDHGIRVTEAGLNGFPESQTARRFKGEPPYSRGDYQILIVAEKYQTGFDEPYLHTMYVDKVLTGLNAVQTLSRLNRVAPGKDATFVLDFRNSADDIREAFQPYYEGSVAVPTNPNVLYDLRARIMDAGILIPAEVTKAAEVYFSVSPEKRNLKVLHANLDPARERFLGLDSEDQQAFRDAADQFTRAYSFLAQVMPFTDVELEKLYVYLKALVSVIRCQPTGGLDLSGDLQLTHLRISQGDAEHVGLEVGEIEAAEAFTGGGRGGAGEPKQEPLAELIAAINERFGTDLDERDRLEIEKIEHTLTMDEALAEFAKANPLDKYVLEFAQRFNAALYGTADRTQHLYELLQTKPDLAKLVQGELARSTYDTVRDSAEESTNER
jgi:type I restriction enzyme R subunit